MRIFLIFIFFLSGCSSLVDTETERNYEAFMVTPNIPEICRAASRPEDAFANSSRNLGAKNGALKALNDRRLQCDWSAEMQYWQDFEKTRAANVVKTTPESNEEGYLVSREHFSGSAYRCNYSNGKRRIVQTNQPCRRSMR